MKPLLTLRLEEGASDADEDEDTGIEGSGENPDEDGEPDK